VKIYNTLTKKEEDFKPLEGNEARIYSCGPTVYDHIHIGNLASFIYADELRQSLTKQGYKVRHVMNITDVDDKTIAKSQALYPDLEPKEALKKLTSHYEEVFMRDMKAVGNNTEAIEFVRATDYIPQMQELIKKLYTDGFAYMADDGVYFSIDAYKKSGKIYGQLTPIDSQNTSESRIQNDEYDKESVHDFALWKLKKDHEPFWEFELDGKDLAGRPGWHIECSAMSAAKLGQPFDIHTGGVDLIFPHHENEIAQSTAGKDENYLARVFFHNEHLLVDGKKMSKSLNNFYTLDDIKKRGFDPLAFRLLVLQSSPKSQSNFSWEIMQAAQNRFNKLHASEKTVQLTPEQQRLVDSREQARANKEWEKADQLRGQLEEQGIGLKDTPDGPIAFQL
jgi:cysteinyl-tRNA synthetase